MLKSRRTVSQTLRDWFGGHFHSVEFGFVVFIGLLLMMFHWLATETHDLVRGVAGQYGPWLVTIGPLVLILVGWLLARNAAGGGVHVNPRNRPSNLYEGLICFLSLPGKDAAKIGQLSDALPVSGNVLDPETRGFFEGSWRMPLESIAAQVGILKCVVVVPSADRDGDPGTFHSLPRFREITEHLVRQAGRPIPIQGLAGFRWEKGVNFVDANEIVDAVVDAVGQLRSQGVSRRHILIDVTGGYALCSAIGALASAAIRCDIAWVDTKTKECRVYGVRVKREADN